MGVVEASVRGFLGITALSYTLSSVAWGWSLFGPRGSVLKTAKVLAVTGLLSHTACLTVTGSALGRFPIFGGTLTMHFFVWALMVAFLLVDWRARLPTLGAFYVPVIACAAIALLEVPAPIVRDGAGTTLNVPPTIVVHVSFVFFGYAFFVLAFLAGVLFLYQSRALKNKRLGPWFQALPSVDDLDRLNVQAIGFGFPLHTIGIAIGLRYAVVTTNYAWMTDPIVLMTFALWLLYSVILSLRYLGKHRGRKIANCTVFGFGVLLICLVVARSQQHGRRAFSSTIQSVESSD